MRIAVIGLGLIGGSLLRALAAAGHEVTGHDAEPATREMARAAGFRVLDTAAGAVAGTEVAVTAVPLPVLPRVLADLAGYDGLVTDVTSVKGPVRALAGEHRVRRFVGGHPMAGTEASGFAAADPELFAGCVWVLCVEPHDTDLDDWLTLARLYTELGARVLPITAAEHDNAVAAISHVPHLLAAALAWRLAGSPLNRALAAGSFRDGSRVAATRPELTAAMCGGNAGEVGRELGHVLHDLEQLRVVLDARDPVAALLDYLRPAAGLRRAWPPGPGLPERLPWPPAPAPDRAAGAAHTLLALGRAGGWVTAVGAGEIRIMRPETDRYPA
ncbi:prephenate dehydrogenase [Actinoplanes teichomyceticus]|uniref:Prephenate dehydrogenase n=1 Tax=Actinoplanes teichomyceticus TaxID=1867 RepID=A0A561WQT2_ACTTI|nr:prephenate dehydrogenase/arogenate dehydrogenase family protein [Actinoplanes teichomyceticus]TWG26208.1 prephenate dehydrogenase [Actinoplanes teichomyceticus]GIF11287.1 prephenate dehydrogenase [Actinoplanes teichomyceticus]